MPAIEGFREGPLEEHPPPCPAPGPVHPLDQPVEPVLDDDDECVAGPRPAGAGERRTRTVAWGSRLADGSSSTSMRGPMASTAARPPAVSRRRTARESRSPEPARPTAPAPRRWPSPSRRRPAKVLQAEGHLVLHGERAELGIGVLEHQAHLVGQHVHRGVSDHQAGHTPACVVALRPDGG